MIRFVFLFSRQGKIRLQKWYDASLAPTEKEKKKVMKDLIGKVLSRKPNMCNFIEWKEYKIVYKRYASLYFLFAVDNENDNAEDNELITLELIHRYVEILDVYFGSVCELDIIYNFEKAHFILDEMVLGGEIQETSKKAVLKYTQFADHLQEEEIMIMAMNDLI